MRIVALEAIAYRWRMNGSFESCCIFVGVATQAESLWRRSNQLDPRNVFVDPNFVTAQAASRDGGVDGFALGLIFVALQAFRGIDVLVERDRMLFGHRRPCREHDHQHKPMKNSGEGMPGTLGNDCRTAWRLQYHGH